MRLRVMLVAMLLVGCEKVLVPPGLSYSPSPEEARSGDNPSQNPPEETNVDYLGLRKGLRLQYTTLDQSDLGSDLGRSENRGSQTFELSTVEIQGEQATASLWVTGADANGTPHSPYTMFYFKQPDGLYRKSSLAPSADLMLPFPVKDSVRVLREATSSTHVEVKEGFTDTVTDMVGAETVTTALGRTVVTPAGTFTNCAEVRVSQHTIRYHAEPSIAFWGQTESGMTLTRWFAPGLGLIKYEQTHYIRDPRIDPMTHDYTSVLATYSVPVEPNRP